MRIVGYVRESADPAAGRPAFEQQEMIRRFAADRGHTVVAVCQDLRDSPDPASRDGYLGLLGILATGAVDAVVVPGLATFSADQIVQEIVLWDLRGRGVQVVSTEEADLPLLDADEGPGPSRMLIRDVLQRVGEHARSLGGQRFEPPAILPDGDVMIHILRADEAEAGEGTVSS